MKAISTLRIKFKKRNIIWILSGNTYKNVDNGLIKYKEVSNVAPKKNFFNTDTILVAQSGNL